MTIEKILDDCANTIRQQESALLAEQKHNEMLMAEIAMLKQIIDANNLQSDIGQFIKPIDEPVAWISVLAIDHIGQKFTDVRVSLTKTDLADIPLYTHPMRELTDEEIEEVAKPYCDLQNWVVDKHEFARAILKKASEK